MHFCCPISGCPYAITMARGMCWFHFGFVPAKLSRAVYEAYNHGECGPEHRARCAEATAAVQRKMNALRN
jgi:hypothetical protein